MVIHKLVSPIRRCYATSKGDEDLMRTIVEVKTRPQLVIDELVAVWEDSVRPTHTFLSSNEVDEIKKYVPQALRNVAHLVTMVDEHGVAVGFMGVEGQKLEMLFIKNKERGKRLGERLLSYGIEHFGVNELVVNEQNPKAHEFYERMGFRVYKRSDVDEQGQPYPVLYMRLED